jgi:hypothetical protein
MKRNYVRKGKAPAGAFSNFMVQMYFFFTEKCFFTSRTFETMAFVDFLSKPRGVEQYRLVNKIFLVHICINTKF